MTKIRSSADLRNCYNEISQYCHEYQEPVFITKNGKGDLAVMSIETYDKLAGRLELYSQLDKGLEDLENGRYSDAFEFMQDLEREFSNEKV